jgi:hypothetical protein
MEDSEDEVKRKIKRCFCWDPESIRKNNKAELEKDPNFVPNEDFITGNTLLEYVKFIIFPYTGHFKVNRPTKFGGPR